MVPNKPLTLLINNNPPQEIIPMLIEWWLTHQKRSKDCTYAEIFQIESVKVKDPDDLYWMDTSVFVNLNEATQSMIISASTKTGTIDYYVEDAEGNPVANAITRDPMQETMHSPNILIYRCLPLSTIKYFEKYGLSNLLGKRIRG
jgi:hypothetical protein